MQKTDTNRTLWVLGLCYAGHYASIGSASLWLPTHYEGLGASGRLIGALLALPSIAACFLPFLAGHLADRFGSPLTLLRASLLSTSLSLIFLTRTQTLSSAFLFGIWMAASVVNVSPLIDTLTLRTAAKGSPGYGRARSLGSLGYVLATGTFATFSSAAPILIPLVLVLVLLLTFSLSNAPAQVTPNNDSSLLDAARALLASRRLRGLLVAFALHWAAVGPYQSFLPLVAKDMGFAVETAPRSFAIAASAEILGMWLVRDRSEKWLFLTFALSSLRWVLTAMSISSEMFIGAQLFHLLTFGSFVVAAQKLVVPEVPEPLRATGQGLFFACVFGAGSGLGTILSGFAYELIGGPSLFWGAAGLEIVAAAAFAWVLTHSRSHG